MAKGELLRRASLLLGIPFYDGTSMVQSRRASSLAQPENKMGGAATEINN